VSESHALMSAELVALRQENDRLREEKDQAVQALRQEVEALRQRYSVLMQQYQDEVELRLAAECDAKTLEEKLAVLRESITVLPQSGGRMP